MLEEREHPQLIRTIQGLYTVSYTHLDVYKRQVFSDADFRPLFFTDRPNQKQYYGF